MKKLTPATAVHKHERNMHPGKALTPFKAGGHVMKKPVVGQNPMKKPKTPAAGTLAMKKGGRACMNMGGMAPRQVFAAGGVAKIRHNQATKSGAPMAAPKRFKEPLI